MTLEIMRNDYKKYLIKKTKDISEIKRNIKTLEDIKFYKDDSKYQLKKLEDLSIDYKLYDHDYNDFMIAMGKFSLCLDIIDHFNEEDKYKKKLQDTFVNIHNDFEELEQRNIMKDVYVWKYLSN